MTEIRVDDAAVRHDDDSSITGSLDRCFDGRDHSGPQPLPDLATGSHTEHRLLLPESSGQLLVTRHDVLEPHPFPRPHEHLSEVVLDVGRQSGFLEVGLEGLAAAPERRDVYARRWFHDEQPSRQSPRLLFAMFTEPRVPLPTSKSLPEIL